MGTIKSAIDFFSLFLVALLSVLLSLSLVSRVVAQGSSTSATAALPTSTAGLSDCIINCTAIGADASGCTSFADVECACTSESFQSTVLACLQQNCSSSDLAVAEELATQECAAAGITVSLPTSSASGATTSKSAAAGRMSANVGAITTVASALVVGGVLGMLVIL